MIKKPFIHRQDIINYLTKIATEVQGNLTVYNQKIGNLRRGMEHLRKSDIFVAQGDYGAAARESKNSLKYISNCFEAIRAAADNLLILEKFREALQYYLALMKKYPDAKDIHYQVGRCYSELKDFPKAIMEFENEIKLSGDAPDIQLQLGFAYHRLGDLIYDEIKKFPLTDNKKKECRALLIRAKRHYQNASEIINQDNLHSWFEEIDLTLSLL